jgi:hypothetical protein
VSEWISIATGELPRIGSRLLTFTPTKYTELRYRICDADSLHYLSGATHWAYLAPPAEHFSQPVEVNRAE